MKTASLLILLLISICVAPVRAEGGKDGCEDIYNDRVANGYSAKEVAEMKKQVVAQMADDSKDDDAIKQARRSLRQSVRKCDQTVQKFGSKSRQAEVSMLNVEDAQGKLSRAVAEKQAGQ